MNAQLTLPRLVIAILFLSLFAMAARVSVDTDTWWHLRTGQWIVTHQSIPQVDPFSFTRAGAAWRIPGWLVQAPLYLVFAAFGYAGLNLFTAAFVTLTFVLVYAACSGPPLLRAFTLVLAAAASAVYWSARPQIVSLALAAAFALLLYRFRAGRGNGLWLLPILMILWVNAHGGFAIGFIFIGLTLAGELLKFAWRLFAVRRWPDAPPPEGPPPSVILWLVGIGLACALAVMVNPAGPEMLAYPFKTVGIGALRDYIQEWQSPNFHQLEAQPFLWLLFATFAVVTFSRRAVDVTDLVLVAGTAYLGFLAGRNVPLLAVAAPPLLTRQAAALLSDLQARTAPDASARPPAPGSIRLNWLLLVVISALALVKVLAVLPANLNTRELARFTPLGAAAFIRQNRPPGPMFNAYNFGAYLMWALYPEYPVYVDGRTDLYDDAFLREYLSVALGRPGYQAVLDRQGVRLVLVEADSLLGDRLNDSPLWQRVYHDDVAVVYTRRP